MNETKLKRPMEAPAYRHLSVYFPPENRLILETLSKAEGTSKARLINKALTFYAQSQNTLVLSNTHKK